MALTQLPVLASATLPHELEYAEEILGSEFGSVAASVCQTLLAYQQGYEGLSLGELLFYLREVRFAIDPSKAPHMEEVRNALLLLMQHNIVRVADRNVFAQHAAKQELLVASAGVAAGGATGAGSSSSSSGGLTTGAAAPSLKRPRRESISPGGPRPTRAGDELQDAHEKINSKVPPATTTPNGTNKLAPGANIAAVAPQAHHAPPLLVKYYGDVEQILCRPRFAEYVLIAADLIDNVAALVLKEILVHGRATVCTLKELLCRRSEIRTPAIGGRGQHHQDLDQHSDPEDDEQDERMDVKSLLEAVCNLEACGCIQTVAALRTRTEREADREANLLVVADGAGAGPSRGGGVGAVRSSRPPRRRGDVKREAHEERQKISKTLLDVKLPSSAARAASGGGAVSSSSTFASKLPWDRVFCANIVRLNQRLLENLVARPLAVTAYEKYGDPVPMPPLDGGADGRTAGHLGSGTTGAALGSASAASRGAGGAHQTHSTVGGASNNNRHQFPGGGSTPAENHAIRKARTAQSAARTAVAETVLRVFLESASMHSDYGGSSPLAGVAAGSGTAASSAPSSSSRSLALNGGVGFFPQPTPSTSGSAASSSFFAAQHHHGATQLSFDSLREKVARLLQRRQHLKVERLKAEGRTSAAIRTSSGVQPCVSDAELQQALAALVASGVIQREDYSPLDLLSGGATTMLNGMTPFTSGHFSLPPHAGVASKAKQAKAKAKKKPPGGAPPAMKKKGTTAANAAASVPLEEQHNELDLEFSGALVEVADHPVLPSGSNISIVGAGGLSIGVEHLGAASATPTSSLLASTTHPHQLFHLNLKQVRAAVHSDLTSRLLHWNFGPLTFRIFNFLAEEPLRYHDERKIEETCLCTLNKMRKALNDLFRNNLLAIQEIPKGAHSVASGPPPTAFGQNSSFGRGLWLYAIDRARLPLVLRKLVVQMMRNVLTRLESEKRGLTMITQLAAAAAAARGTSGGGRESGDAMLISGRGAARGVEDQEELVGAFDVNAETLGKGLEVTDARKEVACDVLTSRFLALQNMYALLRDLS